MHPEDVMMGFNRRRVVIERARKPQDHAISTFVGESLGAMKLESVEQLASLVCDHCNEPIKDGSKCVAVTMWREQEPEPWENDYTL
jgi:hypothetical protein